MKIVAVIEADLIETPLGTRSRLADELGGLTVLGRTVARVGEVEGITECYVLCPGDQYDRCCAILRGSGAIVKRHEAGAPPWRGLTQSARKWSLDGWRGGIGGTSSFDSYTDCRLISGLLKSIEADAALSIPPAAPLLDPTLADGMIDHFESDENGGRVCFSQAPPGLSGIILHKQLVHELAEKGIPVGWIFSYKPDEPQKDSIFLSSCFPIPRELRHSSGRLIADTDRSTETIRDLLDENNDLRGETIGRWLTERQRSYVGSLPREVEIELTTDDPYPNTILRPRGDRVDRRGPIDLGVVERVVAELGSRDDSLIVLGGFGDPLCHPDFMRVLRTLRPQVRHSRGVYGLAVRTCGADLTPAVIEGLIETRVDVLSVCLDAWTAPTHLKVNDPEGRGCPDFSGILQRIDHLEEVRKARGSTRPIVVPEMTKAKENVHELDAFYDGWLRKLGAVSIVGYGHFSGQLEDRSVIPMSPPARFACRRIQDRCMILADGRVVLCDQDCAGSVELGNLSATSLGEIWLGEKMSSIRAQHQSGRFEVTTLCAACDEWHRP
jgi:spiro-SPASM protein